MAKSRRKIFPPAYRSVVSSKFEQKVTPVQTNWGIYVYNSQGEATMAEAWIQGFPVQEILEPSDGRALARAVTIH